MGTLEAIAAEGADRLAHIGLVVMTFAEGKQLEQLTGQVFVGVAAVVGGVVEGDLQDRIAQLTPVHREYPQPQLHLPETALLWTPGQLRQPAALQVGGLATLAGAALLWGQGAAGLGGGLDRPAALRFANLWGLVGRCYR
jgi:hypothetical protein